MGNENPTIIEKTTTDLSTYLRLRIDKFHLGLLENLSKFCGSVFSVFLAAMLGTIALFFFAGALTMILAAWVGSYIIAFVIVGAIFMVASIIIFCVGDRLVINRVIRRYSKVMMDLNKKDSDYEPY